MYFGIKRVQVPNFQIRKQTCYHNFKRASFASIPSLTVNTKLNDNLRTLHSNQQLCKYQPNIIFKIQRFSIQTKNTIFDDNFFNTNDLPDGIIEEYVTPPPFQNKDSPDGIIEEYVTPPPSFHKKNSHKFRGEEDNYNNSDNNKNNFSKKKFHYENLYNDNYDDIGEEKKNKKKAKKEEKEEENVKRDKKVKLQFNEKTFYYDVYNKMTFKKLLSEVLAQNNIHHADQANYYLVDAKHAYFYSPTKAKTIFYHFTELYNTRFLCTEENDDTPTLRIMNVNEYHEYHALNSAPSSLSTSADATAHHDREVVKILNRLGKRKSRNNFADHQIHNYSEEELEIIKELDKLFGKELDQVHDIRGLIEVMQDGVVEEKIWKFCFSDVNTSQIIKILLLHHNSSNFQNNVYLNELNDGDDYYSNNNDSINIKDKIKFLYSALTYFSHSAIQTVPYRVRTALRTSNDKESFDILLPEFLKYFRREYIFSNDDFFSFLDNQQTPDLSIDLSSPHQWYPKARCIRRKIILHIGPTNSGKTYNALEDLKSSLSGVYCGPLRILANEIYEKLLDQGIPTSLMTGQQKKVIEKAKHISCTVEMADIDNEVDCAVIDEIQMITDPHRGWAWTRAVLGIPASTIHLCGNESVVGIIQNICNKIGDTLEIKRYDRLSPLTASLHPVESIEDLQPGDCVIAFSRKLLYNTKRKIEQSTKLRCSIVHGKLPPESRNQQASLFNSKNSGYDVLVASDAIGMGLNLNIRRILFLSTLKYDGETDRPLTISEIKQIAGRAGRFSGEYKEGITASFSYEDSLRIARAIKTELPQLTFAGLLPEFQLIEQFSRLFSPTTLFSKILQKIQYSAILDNDYFLCNARETMFLAKLIDNLDFDLKDRYTFCTAPVDIKDKLSLSMFKRYAQIFSDSTKTQKIFPIKLSLSCRSYFNDVSRPFTQHDLQLLNSINQAIDTYLWLGNHYPDHFSDLENAQVEQSKCHALTEKALRDITILPPPVRKQKKKDLVKKLLE